MSKRRQTSADPARVESERMLRRVGRTAREQLRWVLAFAERDLSVLDTGERIALASDLVWLPGRVAQAGPPPPPGPEPARPTERGNPVPVELGALQRDVREALHAYFTADGFVLPSAELRLQRDPETGQAHSVYAQGPSVAAGILLAIATLITRVGAAYRACPTCGRPFVANNRQGYCSSRCSMLMRRRRHEAKTTHTRRGKTQ